MTTTDRKQSRLRVKVPVELATEIAQKGIGAFGPDSPEVIRGVRVVQMWYNYIDYYDNKPLQLVVQWGGQFFKNADEYCYIGRSGDICDPDEHVSHFNELGKEVVEFQEVFPETVEHTVYR